MAFGMSISSSAGTFTFDSENNDVPKFGREVEYIRLDPQGPSLRRVVITLTGQWLKDDLTEIMDVYDDLCNVLKANNVNFSYDDGSTAHYAAKRMQVERYTEPDEWKQYDGTFVIVLYYFESHTASLGITVSYGGYTFEHVPTWSRKITPSRKNLYFTTSPAGQTLGSVGEIQLRGFLTASAHAALKTKIDALEAALATNATLTYGSFVQDCAVFDRSIVETVPDTQAFFTIDLQYAIGDIINLSVKRRFSRLHRNPVIKEKPLCNSRVIKFMNLSGQVIDYSMSIQAASVTQCRTLLTTEVSNAVFFGGFELEGGFEEWDEDTYTVNVLIKKFYNSFILANMQSIPLILFNGGFDPAG